MVNKNLFKDLYNNFRKVFENYPYSDHDPYKNYFKKVFKKLK